MFESTMDLTASLMAALKQSGVDILICDKSPTGAKRIVAILDNALGELRFKQSKGKARNNIIGFA